MEEELRKEDRFKRGERSGSGPRGTAKATHPCEEPQELAEQEVLFQLLPLTSHHDPTEDVQDQD